MDDIQRLKEELSQVKGTWRLAWEKGEYSQVAELMKAEALAESALALGQEAAVVIDWKPAWDIGAPLPHVLASGQGIFLLYLPRPEPDPDWDGTTVMLVMGEENSEVAIVNFDRPVAFKMGSPNDEVLHGHRLYGRGLLSYSAHEIKNSSWLAELEQANSVHHYYKAENWQSRKHYLLSFHDETFECIASGYSVEVVQSSLAEALKMTIEKL